MLAQQQMTDAELSKKFIADIKAKVPHLQEEPSGPVIVNATPLIEITSLLIECARAEYGLEISSKNAKVYGGFCPEQYDNELNVMVHEAVTGPEIDQQLKSLGHSLAEFRVICTFGTGGTSTGISNYLKKKYNRKTVHAVFPLANQDVGGIRTREKALGLRFYRPEFYAGQHEVDFEAARRVLRFFAGKGYNVGESSALALYACLQMLNFGVGDKFVVMIADGNEKYLQSLETRVGETRRYEVTFEEARSRLSGYGEVLWTHTMFVPTDEGLNLISSSLGCDKSRVKVARARDVETVISNQEVPETKLAFLDCKGLKASGSLRHFSKPSVDSIVERILLEATIF